METNGNLPAIIENDAGLYEGNLIRYSQIVFNHATNLRNPYHNFRHMTHVLWLCYEACWFYKDELTAREMRNLLIAAFFHDFNHFGHAGDDDLNIQKAVREISRRILVEDKENLPEIVKLIKATEYPYKIPSRELSLSEQIIRDADLSQCFSVAWIQQVIFGLATEWEKEPIEVLEMQISFLGNLMYSTLWAQQMYPKETIEAKIAESRRLVKILKEEPSTIN